MSLHRTGRKALMKALKGVKNPLSKIHHAAFDAHLIGIDPDYRRRRFPDLRWG
jgi:hypothetical protein